LVISAPIISDHVTNSGLKTTPYVIAGNDLRAKTPTPPYYASSPVLKPPLKLDPGSNDLRDCSLISSLENHQDSVPKLPLQNLNVLSVVNVPNGNAEDRAKNSDYMGKYHI